MPRPRTSRRAAGGSVTEARSVAALTEGRCALVVGIGASAGSLDALKDFFGAMPPKTGCAFVVVDLDPMRESPMPELLAASTPMRVEHARDREPLDADRVYVIPPNRVLTMSGGSIHIGKASNRPGRSGVLDQFFRSLAGDQGARAVAVVLAGTGNGGTRGLRAIKAEGGLVMAQAPETTRQPGMPERAIATGLVDLVLPPHEMPDALLFYARKTGFGDGAITTTLGALPLDDLQATLSVRTPFFRDPAAFDELATTVLANLVRERDAHTPMRIWVPGCATGEEAYSIAILAAEQIAAAQSKRSVRVFATDPDASALAIARAAAYPESLTTDISPERLTRFFTRDSRGYVVEPSIRESVVFAVQDAMSGPPFSTLDLVCCASLLIDLEPPVLQKLMTIFQLALNPGGYLFLGSAERTIPPVSWFARVSQRSGIFRRLETAGRARLAASAPQAAPDAEPGEAKRSIDSEKTRSSDSTIAGLANRVLLDYLAPAAVVVTAGGQITRIYGGMDKYITLPTGEATFDLLVLARAPLKAALRAALHAPAGRSRPTAFEAAVMRGRTRSIVRIAVWTLDAPDMTGGARLIVFEEPRGASGRTSTRPDGDMAALVERLEGEVAAAKKDYQQLVKQFERSNQELGAATEEVLSTNEELANLFVSTDIATVFVDEAFRIKRFTPAAGRLLNLLASDVGRPLSHLATNLVDVDMVAEARSVLATLEPIEKAVDARDGAHYMLRVLPYRSEHDVVHGVVLTLSNVTSLKKAEEELKAATARLSLDLRHMSRLHALSTRLSGPGVLPSLLDDAVRAAVEITGADMGYIHVLDETGALEIAAQGGCPPLLLDFVHRIPSGGTSIEAVALAERARVIVEDVRESPILRDSASLNALLAAGVRTAQSTPLVGLSGELVGMLSTHTRTADRITDGNLRWLDLLARQAADVIERRRFEDMRERAKDTLNQRVRERTKWLTLLHDISQAIDQAPNWNDALRLVMSRICESEGWQVGCVYLPAADASDHLVAAVTYSADTRFAPFHLVSQQVRHTVGMFLPGRVFADGRHVWINGEAELLSLMPAREAVAREVGLQSAVALPVRVGNATLAVVELLSDRHHLESDELVRLMSDVSTQVGRVIERENTMAQVSEIIWGEQQDLIQTLHDSLGQQLTGLGMLAASLNRRLASTDHESASTARQIATTAEDALERVRQLAKGLFQADVDNAGFLEALRDLASNTMAMHGIDCSVEGDAAVVIPSGRAATQLYRIAQEAVTNAVRHAEAARITIRLLAEAGVTTLTVTDDGVGLHHRTPKENGIGLRIMRHRAASIGAVFSVRAGVDGGTVVKVVL